MKSAFLRLVGTLVILASLMAVAAGVASAGAPVVLEGRYVYWTDYNAGRLLRADVGGGPAEVVVASSGGGSNGVAVDRQTGRIYWASRGDNAIRSVNPDGSDVQTLNVGAAPIVDPVGVAIDARSGRIYWASSADNAVGWAALDGSGGGSLNLGSAPVTSPQGVALDSIDGKIFWANTDPSTAPGGWVKLDGSGTGGSLGQTGITGAPIGLAYAPNLLSVFWTDYYGTQVYSASTDGSPEVALNISPETLSEPGGVGFDAASGRLYIADYAAGSIKFANADGSGGGGTLAAGWGGSPWGSPAASGAGLLSSSNAPLKISAVAGTPTAGVLKLQNTGNYPIEIYGVTVTGSNAFQVGAGCPARLAIAESCDMTITYTPGGSAADSGNVEITTDAAKGSFPVSGTSNATPKEVKLTGVHAVKRCAEPTGAGALSVEYTSATATSLDVTLQRSSTQRRSLPSRCPARAGQTDFMSKLIGKQSKKSFNAVAGTQASTLKQMFGTKKLSPGRYRMLFNYKNSSGETVRKGTWFWVLDK